MIETTKPVPILKGYKSDYPKKQVILFFTLFSSFVGGAITGASVAILAYLSQLSELASRNLIDDIIGLIAFMILSGFFGVFIGGLPALLTGLQLAKQRFTKQTPDYSKKALKIGGRTTLYFGMVMVIIITIANIVVGNISDMFNIDMVLGFIWALIGYVILGGVSAFIGSHFTLPEKD